MQLRRIVLLLEGDGGREVSHDHVCCGCHQQEEQAAMLRLVEAVRALYYAGVWKCDRPVDEIKLWTDVRNAAGFIEGRSPRPIFLHANDL